VRQSDLEDVDLDGGPVAITERSDVAQVVAQSAQEFVSGRAAAAQDGEDEGRTGDEEFVVKRSQLRQPPSGADEATKHPAFRFATVAGVIADRLDHRQLSRWKQPGIVNDAFEEGPQAPSHDTLSRRAAVQGDVVGRGQFAGSRLFCIPGSRWCKPTGES